MSKRPYVLILALSLMGLAGAKAANGTPNTFNSPMLPANDVADWGREVRVWTSAGLADKGTFTKTELGVDRVPEALADDAGLLEAATAIPPEQERSESRVPEPATLIFVGTGLIGIARFLRRKKLEWKLQYTAMPIPVTAGQEV